MDANDIQGTNEMMQMWQKEHCDRAFATDKVTSTGQIIAGIVGTSKRIAQKAASLGIFQNYPPGYIMILHFFKEHIKLFTGISTLYPRN